MHFLRDAFFEVGNQSKRGSVNKSDARSSAIRIIGLGNSIRGDDAVGLLVARLLRSKVGGHVDVIEAESAGVELLELMAGAHVVLLIDAARSGQDPGTIHCLDASAGPIAPELFPRSTHAIGVGEALELARTFDVLPKKVILYGIEAGDTQVGHPLSPGVTNALHDVVKLVLQEVESPACTNSI
jgi:hydrogenase maturation protease